MLRFVRIVIAMVIVTVVWGTVHRALHLGPEFFGAGIPGVVDLGLLIAAALFVSLTDRELFWLAQPKRKRLKRRSGTTA
jgi:hypothetical protein